MNCSRSMVLIIALLWWPIIGHAQPNEDPQERCRKQAEEWFQPFQRVLETDGYTTSFDFENHYSLRLNKCFYLLTMKVFRTDSKSPDQGGKLMWLHDLNDNTQYGEYGHLSDDHRLLGVSPETVGILVCEVRGKRCRSEQEWRELIKPFMED
jgi:hypothetical protein